MKQFSLKVESREKTGRRVSRAGRREGVVPAVIYGKQSPQGLMIDSKTFARLYKQVAGITAILELENEKGAKKLALIQEVQRDHLTDGFNHVDFLEVKATEPMKAKLKVKTVGECIGVKMENALLEVVYPQITVHCLPKDLPDFIEINVEAMHAGDAVFMRDIKAIAGVTFAEKADQVVITCNVPEVEEEKAPEVVATTEGAAPAVGADGKPVAAAVGADGKPVAAAAATDAKDAKAEGKKK